MIEHEVAPEPPRVGAAKITVKVSDLSGAPLSDARVTIEGNMSHAGMQPVFSDAVAQGAGSYQAPIEFTMAGDWIVIVRVGLPDGRKIERQIEIGSVKPE